MQGLLLRAFLPGWAAILWTGMSLISSFTPGQNHHSLQPANVLPVWNAKDEYAGIRRLDDNCGSFFWLMFRMFLGSVSLWLGCNNSTSSVLPLFIDTASFPFLNSPPITSCSMANLRQHSDRKVTRLALFRGFDMYFYQCFGTGVSWPLMTISKTFTSPLLLHSPRLIDTGQYWSKQCPPSSNHVL